MDNYDKVFLAVSLEQKYMYVKPNIEDKADINEMTLDLIVTLCT